MDAGDIKDDDWLLRRIPPWHSPQENQNEPEGGGTFRPPSSAFSLDKGEKGLSFHLESSLRAAGEPLTYGCPEETPGWAVTNISMKTIKQMGFRILGDELPHHVLVIGLADLEGKARRRAQRDIARHSIYVVPPRVL